MSHSSRGFLQGFAFLALLFILLVKCQGQKHEFDSRNVEEYHRTGQDICRSMIEVIRDDVYTGGSDMRVLSVVTDQTLTNLNVTIRPFVNLDVIIRHVGKGRRFGLAQGRPLSIHLHEQWLRESVASVVNSTLEVFATLQFIKADQRLPLKVADVQITMGGVDLNCTDINVGEVPVTSPVTRERRRRAVETMEWFKVQEYAHQSILWFTPITSSYGINTLALAGGRDFFVGHEYVELPGLQNAQNVIWIPGMLSAGPIRQMDDWDSEYGQGRSLLRYSNRDAAWLVWNYNTNKPMWNGNWGRDYWQEHTPAVPATIRAIVFNAPLLG